MYRDDRPRCPTCAEPAEGYDAVWDYYRCANGHRWDGPANGGPPGAERIPMYNPRMHAMPSPKQIAQSSICHGVVTSSSGPAGLRREFATRAESICELLDRMEECNSIGGFDEELSRALDRIERKISDIRPG